MYCTAAFRTTGYVTTALYKTSNGRMSGNGQWVCYCLVSTATTRHSYVGATNNIVRRLRQHNGEIVGGARYTSSPTLRPWALGLLATGFASKSDALSFERGWKNVSRNTSYQHVPPIGLVKVVDRRLRAATKLRDSKHRHAHIAVHSNTSTLPESLQQRVCFYEQDSVNP